MRYPQDELMVRLMAGSILSYRRKRKLNPYLVGLVFLAFVCLVSFVAVKP